MENYPPIYFDGCQWIARQAQEEEEGGGDYILELSGDTKL